jgi:hypothetical protein
VGIYVNKSSVDLPRTVRSEGLVPGYEIRDNINFADTTLLILESSNPDRLVTVC